MQVKTTMRYHITPARVAILKKTTNNKAGRICKFLTTSVTRRQHCPAGHTHCHGLSAFPVLQKDRFTPSPGSSNLPPHLLSCSRLVTWPPGREEAEPFLYCDLHPPAGLLLPLCQESQRPSKASSRTSWWSNGKNLPCNAEDTGSIPGLGRSHVPWS